MADQGAPFKKSSLCEGCPAFYDPCLDSGAGDDPAHLIVVGSAPSGFSVGNRQPFFGREGRLFKDMLKTIRQYQGGKYKDVKVYYTYAVKAGAYEPKAGHLSHCQVNLQRELNRIRGAIPRRNPIVVPLGPVAAKAVGVKMRRIADVIGREMTVTVADSSPQGYRKLIVVPLLSMKHVLAKLGTANVVMSALLRATQLACDPEVKPKSLDEVTKDYVFPQTIDEVKNLVDHIIGYYNPERGTGPEDWFISLDTETNTLRPYSHPDPKTLMLSVAWDDGKAASILLNHPECPYDPMEAWAHVERLLRCPKPKVLHNWKFDQKFIETRRAIEAAKLQEIAAGKFDVDFMRRQISTFRVNNVAWDTMLGEHYIDEDKKGHYRLKQLVPLYAAEYQGYDETLQNFLRGKEEDEERSVEVEDTSNGDEYPPLYLTDDELSDYIVYVSVNGINTGRPDDDWDKLAQAVSTKDTIQKVKAKERTEEQLKQLENARAEIKTLRKTMNIVSPKKESAKKVVGTADEGFQHIPLGTLRKYAAADADVTRLILKSQTVRLHNTELYEEGVGVMKSLYLPGSRTLSAMEYRGFTVDQEHLEKTVFEVEKRLASAESYVHAKFDPSLNLNSPKQISAYMGKLNFASLDSGDTGGTGKDILDQYMEKYAEDDPRHQFCLQLLEFRESHKTLNTYLKPIRRFSKADGKVHCGFNLNGTATGRLSSSKPNMQNIPLYAARRAKEGADGKEIVVHPGYNIKKLFVPSKPGNLIVNVDIKGAEIRVYTAYAHDEAMIDSLNKGIDTHSWVTSMVYKDKLTYDQIQAGKETDPTIKKWRTDCKKVFFSTLYGGSEYKIRQLISSTLEYARELQQSIYASLPKMRAYVDDVALQVHNRRILKTLFGRCRRFRLAHVTSEMMAEAIREGTNFLIQSTSSDLVLSQLCEIDEHIHEIDGELLITVHDSLTFEIPDQSVPLLFPFLDRWITQRVKERFPWLPVDFLYDVEIGPSYGELKPLRRPKKETTC
jgi:DNA polymerase I-like protein with 3'-5' exonuclease and polymerase domains/uracil-DNA glycosylase